MEFIENTEETTPPHIKEEITTFASTTNLLDIFYTDNSSYLLARDELTSLANSSACFSVSCDFETICLNRTSLESLSNNILFTSIDKSKLGIALNSDFNSLGILILISSINNKDNLDYLKLSNAESVSFVVVPEENEGNCFVLFVDNKFKDKTFENVNSSFSSEFMPEGFVMQGVEEDLVNFFVNNFSEQRISFGCLINSFLTDRHEIRGINHFSDSRNFIEALCPIGISFNALFNSSICSFLGVNSSTGCQSICSQNSQSSSVTSRVCLNFSDMSCFINLITAPTNNLESNFKFSSGELINSINNKDNLDYLKLSKELPARCRSQIDKLLMQNLKFDVMIDYELINEKNLVNTI